MLDCFFWQAGNCQDLAAGIAWMKQAGQCGYAQAYCNLARLYDSGEFLEQDVNLALEYHRLAAEMGNMHCV